MPTPCQHLVLRLFALADPIALSHVKRWFIPSGTNFTGDKEYEQASVQKHLGRLKQWGILQGREHLVWLHPIFRDSLLNLWLPSADSMGLHSPIENALEYNNSIWEDLLGFMIVNGGNQDILSAGEWPQPKRHIMNLLIDSGLMRYEESESDDEKSQRKAQRDSSSLKRRDSLSITHYGFQFLLMSKYSQLWTLILHGLGSYTRSARLSDPVASECLCLLAHILFDSSLYGHSIRQYTRPQQEMIQDLMVGIGLVHIPPGSDLFYPTAAIQDLLLDSPAKNMNITPKLSLIVEPNYHVYAYTDSRLYLAMVSLFVRIQSNFPSFVAGVLDRDSCLRAFSHGITANQIVSFLTHHAHPQMLQKRAAGQLSVIPITLVDQLHLWGREIHRIKLNRNAYLYHEFVHAPEYERMVEMGKNVNGLLLAVPEKRVLVMSYEGHRQIKASQ